LITIMTDFDQEGFEREVEAKLNSLTYISPEQMREIAEMAVVDIKEGIDTGQDLQGSAFVPNTPRWIKKKGNSTVYKGKTNKLYNSISVESVTATNKGTEAIIVARGNGLHWQTDPKYPGFKRVFFGFSKRFDNKLLDYLRKNFG